MTSTIRSIENGDLYSLLSVCSNEELQPLVDCILGKFSNFLSIYKEYKEFSPCHTKYHKAIGDELRLYGGNTFGNIYRSGGPSYDTVVIDVCKQLSIAYKSGQTTDNESRLLTFYFEGQWAALSSDERENLIAKACQKATKQVGYSARQKRTAPRVLLGAALPVVGVGTLAVRITGPAFSVTVPCVLHIAYLRRKYLETNLNSAKHWQAHVPASKRHQSPNPSHEPEYAAALVIGESASNPVLSILEVQAPTIPKHWQPVDAGNQSISRLNPLLQAVPSLVNAAEVAGATGIKYMEVIANGALTQVRNGEGYRGFIIGPLGIESHAKLLDPSHLASVANAAAIWQVASVIVAQKHLADISAKLDQIKTAVGKIAEHQIDLRRGQWNGINQYLAQVAQPILTGELSPSVRNMIEITEVQLLQIQEHLILDIQKRIDGTRGIEGDATFGSKGIYDAIKLHQNSMASLYEELLLCLRGRCCGWQLLLAFPGEEGIKEHRKNTILKAFDALSQSSELLKQTDGHMRHKIEDVVSIFNSNTIVNDRKLELLAWSPELTLKVMRTAARCVEDVSKIDEANRKQGKTAKLLIKVENDKILATCAV